MTDSEHRHPHRRGEAEPNPATDLSIPDAELKPHELNRREFLRGLGLIEVAVGARGLAESLVSPQPARSGAIERVEALGADAGPASLTHLRDFVRPQLREGRLVLVVTPPAEGSFQPFESRNTHQCSEDHSA